MTKGESESESELTKVFDEDTITLYERERSAAFSSREPRQKLTLFIPEWCTPTPRRRADMSPEERGKGQFASFLAPAPSSKLTCRQSEPSEIVDLLLELDLRESTTDKGELLRWIVRVEQVGALLLCTSTVVVVVLLVARSRLGGLRLLGGKLLVLLSLLQL